MHVLCYHEFWLQHSTISDKSHQYGQALDALSILNIHFAPQGEKKIVAYVPHFGIFW